MSWLIKTSRQQCDRRQHHLSASLNAEENCCDSLGQRTDSQSGWDLALRLQPDRPKGKGGQFNLTDLRDEGKITSINSLETSHNGG